MLVLAVMALVVFTLSTLRFRRDLAPAGGPVQPGDSAKEAGGRDAAAEATA
jgi:hypothetical protein